MATKRTKALNATAKVRSIVYERDSMDGVPVCQICFTGQQPLDLAHFISKSQSGLGIPQNLIVLCRTHHSLFDHGYPEERRTMKRQIREILQSKYPDWDESKLIYKKDGF
jgi:5-methylcytosine-specific restriction endonuclease McrA